MKKNKKYFVVSDIHGFAHECRSALFKAGFRQTCPQHILIVCGDLFDRGKEAIDVYNFLQSIPQERLILIKGNHESLYFELLNKKYPESHDFMNFTVDTFCQIAIDSFKQDQQKLEYLTWCNQEYFMPRIFEDSETPTVQKNWQLVKEAVANHAITAWLQKDIWKNYYELDNYIFVHSFIPVKNLDGLPSQYIKNRHFEYFKDWRTAATDLEWEDARWGCPWQQYADGLFKEEAKDNKVLVCGHWHTSDFFKHLGHWGSTSCSDIFCGDNIIALDGGVFKQYLSEYSSDYILVHPQNVLIVIGDKCYDIAGKKLGIPLTSQEPQPYTVEAIELASDSYWVNPALDAKQYDLCFCGANCNTPCARKNNPPQGICTVADFSQHCTKFQKKR